MPRSAAGRRVVVTAMAALLTIVGSGGWSSTARADESEARALVKLMLDQARITFSGRMRLSSPGGMERVLDVRHAQRDDGSSTYMEITAPYIMKGTRFLSFEHDNADDEHYTFVPVVRRSIQVPQWTLQQSFLGSTFYMIDISSPEMNDFAYSIVGSATFDARHCRKVEGVSLRADYPYRRIIYCVSPDIGLSLSTEYFDSGDKLLKVWTAQKIAQIDGIWVPLTQSMENVQSKVVSTLEIEEIHIRAAIPPATFTKAYLDR